MYDPCEMNLIYSTRKHKLETPMTDDRDVMQWTLQWIDSVEPFERLLIEKMFSKILFQNEIIFELLHKHNQSKQLRGRCI